MNQQALLMMRGLSPSELALIQELTRNMSEAQEQQFYMLYHGRRKDEQQLLLLALVGFLGFAGIHRLVTEDYALGIVYLITFGFCGIGTIVDLVNISNLTFEYNRKQAMDTARMVTMMVK